MSDTLIHRGPDDSGIWVDTDVSIALGHRRLSIIDLSPEGHQPMLSASGRYVTVLNGEIYNFQVLRKELEGDLKVEASNWRGYSDTEVMLAAFDSWGVENAVKRFIGMFAFALWDRKERRLHLVRDRLGEKPLYYGLLSKTFLFASELKALDAHPDFRPEISRDALALYMRHNCIPAPYSIYKDIYKLLPGTILTIEARNKELGNLQPFIPKPYWQARKIAECGVDNMFGGTEPEAVDYLDSLLHDTVRQQMVADVPLGAFLSGGVDSSTIVAIMQAESSRPVKTFTMGVKEKPYSEADYAKSVAKHLGTDHTELYVTPKQVMEVIPKMAHLYDEPFADSSQVPTFLLSQLTRRHVTVSLSGDGGDELFAGYNRHFWGRDIWHKFGWLPKKVRQHIANFLLSVSPHKWNSLFRLFDNILPTKYKEQLPGERLHKLAEIFASESPNAMYYGLVSHWKDPTSLVINAEEPLTFITDYNKWAKLDDFSEKMMYLDQVTYLPDDILVKVDRAGMGVSLETRMPFLDHRIVEFSWQVPISMKIRNGRGKWILRQVLDRYVPKKLIDRKKMGFGIPIGIWLRDSLRDWAEALIDEKRIQEEGFFNPVAIRKKWEEHISCSSNWQYHLWDVLMFQAWLEEQKRHI